MRSPGKCLLSNCVLLREFSWRKQTASDEDVGLSRTSLRRALGRAPFPQASDVVDRIEYNSYKRVPACSSCSFSPVFN